MKQIKIVVFDDDPTGIQTVHDCLLVTQWDEQTIREAFCHETNIFYVLTNTRAMTRSQAASVTREAVEMVVKVSRNFHFRLIFISRSDSCLRGHFPLETDVIRDVLRENGIKIWNKIPFVPCFIESGRYTIDGVQYMKDGDKLIPVSQTEFAHDNVFAYTNSTLTEYIKEKGANPEEYQIVNAASYKELNNFSACLLEETKDFDGVVVIRSSSSLPKSLSGMDDKPLLSAFMDKPSGRADYLDESSGRADGNSQSSAPGLFIVGSHVAKTTRQLNALLACPGVKGIEIDVEDILNSSTLPIRESWGVSSLNSQLSTLNSKPSAFVIYTSRKEVRVDDPDKRQQLGQQVSDYLVRLVREIITSIQSDEENGPKLAYLVAKGGITSHDILTKALEVRSATVLGQIIPSVPCIQTEHFPYIIFPGNVGNDDSLKELYLKLSNEKEPL